MGYTLRMSDEMHEWLADLRASDPAAARQVAEAVTTLMTEGASLGPPLVVPVTTYRRPVTLTASLDESYQVCLQGLQTIRRRVADVATERTRLRKQVDALAAADDPGNADQLAGLRRRLAAVTQAEAKLTMQSRRVQDQVDAFRTRKEVLKASHVAVQAQQRVRQILDQLDSEADPPGAPGQESDSLAPGADAGEAGVAAAVSGGPARAADVGEAGTPAAGGLATAGMKDADGVSEELARIEREIQREIDRVLPLVPVAAGTGDAQAAGLMELRPGAPGDSGIRILFGVEPPGAALLISVLEGEQALRDHYDEAAELSAEVLTQARAGAAPEAGAHAFDDADGFLGEFLPDEADQISAGAADLAARNRGSTLAEQRARLGLTQAQVAERMGVRQERVSAIERAEPGATEVRTLAAYVEALGGRLEIIADFGADGVLLRGPAEPPA